MPRIHYMKCHATHSLYEMQWLLPVD